MSAHSESAAKARGERDPVNESGRELSPITALVRCTDGASREWHRGAHVISTDKRRLDVDAVHAYLSRSYWAEQIPRAVVELSIENSLCFGIYEVSASTKIADRSGALDARANDGRRERQVGFARLVTDGATFAYLGDVYVLEDSRGKGLSKWLMHAITSMPELQGLRRWNLATRDAHGLYAHFGFRALAAPERYMERLDPDVYRRAVGGDDVRQPMDR
jgi:GNAT superfamily N-acetyltransferase